MAWHDYHNLAYWADDWDEAGEEGHEGREYLKLQAETEKAVLLEMKPGVEWWLPKSQIRIDREQKRVWIPEWLASRKRLGL